MLNPLSWLGPLMQLITAIEDPVLPTVALDNITVTGIASGNIHSFLGIPFATAPRFALPRPVTYSENINATSYGRTCIQHNLLTTATPAFLEYLASLTDPDAPTPLPSPVRTSESCLTINVIRPATANENSNLPVVVWFFGGGFLVGDDKSWHVMGSNLVEKSLEESSEDVIFVSFNYRLSAYGFLGGAEIKEAGVGNLGLRDQRVALEWVHDHISAFGGNPEKVILWGQSSGAISAALQMVAYDGNNQGLFHGAFLQSGAPIPLGSITNGQESFDALVSAVGCDVDQNVDKLECLRSVPLEVLKPVVDATDGIFSEKALLLNWRPSVDGDFLADNPPQLVRAGKVADVPIVAGNMDDEGTMFSVAKTGSITTDADFGAWIESAWLPNATEAERANVYLQYPNAPAQGSPFGTGLLNQYKDNKQYKRIAAFQGDMVFQAPRRFFVKELTNLVNHGSNVFVYLSKRRKIYPTVGSFHGADVDKTAPNHNLFLEHVVKFASSFNPTLSSSNPWPTYTSEDKKMWVYTSLGQEISTDDHRTTSFELLNELALKYPL